MVRRVARGQVGGARSGGWPAVRSVARGQVGGAWSGGWRAVRRVACGQAGGPRSGRWPAVRRVGRGQVGGLRSGGWCAAPSPCRGPHGQRAARWGPRQRFQRKAARLPVVRRPAGPCGVHAGTSAPCVADRMLALAPRLQEVVEDTCG